MLVTKLMERYQQSGLASLPYVSAEGWHTKRGNPGRNRVDAGLGTVLLKSC